MFRRARYPRVSSDKIFIYVYDVIVLRITVEIYLQFEVNGRLSVLSFHM